MATPVDSLDPAAYLAAMTTAAGVLEDHAVALDRLQSPEGSESGSGSPSPGVGSDLAATLSGAVIAAEGGGDFATISTALEQGARAASSTRAGRGAATLLSGIGEVLRNVDRLDSTRFALALEAGAERLAPADDGRHPGGFAAVANVVADAALAAADRGSELGETVLAAAGAGIEELERGPALDARLAARGTVDAAAAGLLLVLDTMASVVTGEPLPTRRPVAEAPVGGTRRAADRYDVSCRLLPDDPGVEVAADLESVLVRLAELTRWDVAGGSWEISLRTPLPGAAIEALAEVGRPRELHIAVVVDAASGTTPSTGSLLGTPG